MGDWAPTVLGVGRDVFGLTWLSISTTIDNKPIDYQPLDYDVELVPVPSNGVLSGKCKLRRGKYCSGDNYENCNDTGCTVSIFGGPVSRLANSFSLQVQLMSGEAKYVLKDS